MERKRHSRERTACAKHERPKKKRHRRFHRAKWLAGEHEWQGGGWRWEVVRSAGERWSRAKENTSRVLKRERERMVMSRSLSAGLRRFLVITGP